MSASDHTTPPCYTLVKPIVLVGMMGSGKTAIGTALAERLDVPFVDSDAALVEAADRSIAEIFERDGEAFFRARETEVIARLLSGAQCVLSTRGRRVPGPTNRDLIDRHGVSVWLKADIELLWSRVRHKTTRPLLRTSNPRKTLEDIANERNPIYAQSNLSVQAKAAYSIADMVDAVIEVLLDANIIQEKS